MPNHHIKSKLLGTLIPYLAVGAIAVGAVHPRAAVGWQFVDPQPEASAAQNRRLQQAPLPQATNSTAAGFIEDGAADGEDHSAIRPATFQGLTPGQATIEEVLQVLGEPAERVPRGEFMVWRYDIAPLFSAVELLLRENQLHSIVFHLRSPLAEADVTGELQLARFTPAVVPDAAGKLLGHAYPERGVMLGLLGDAKTDRKVTQIVLEAISADAFVHRVLYDSDHRFSENLRDLDSAIRLQPKNSQAYWLRARLNEALGNFAAALNDADMAVRFDVNHAQYRLTRARLLYLTGDHPRAMKEIRSIISRNEDVEVEAFAECMLGDFLIGGPGRDPKLALEHHQTAIRLATQLTKNAHPPLIRSAKRILLDAYLGAAHDIAEGDFANKDEVVPSWLKRADDLARTLAAEGHPDATLQLDLRRRKLRTLCRIRSDQDLDSVVEELFDRGREFIADARDPLYRNHLEWKLVEALGEAVACEHEHRNFELVMKYFQNAIVLAEPQLDLRPASPQREQTLGALYFYAGSAHALDRNNHVEAITYFQKAIPYLESPLAVDQFDDRAVHAERLVSMGVSFWETGNQKQAISVTQSGLRMLEQAVRDGRVTDSALAVPLGNLAAMYQATGRNEEAKVLSAMARKAESPPAGLK